MNYRHQRTKRKDRFRHPREGTTLSLNNADCYGTGLLGLFCKFVFFLSSGKTRLLQKCSTPCCNANLTNCTKPIPANTNTDGTRGTCGGTSPDLRTSRGTWMRSKFTADSCCQRSSECRQGLNEYRESWHGEIYPAIPVLPFATTVILSTSWSTWITSTSE